MGPAPGAAAPAAKAPVPAAAKRPAPAAAPALSREEIDAMRSRVVTALEEARQLGEQVTIDVLHKETKFTGRVVRIDPAEGFAVLENPDGRRRGLWFILGGALRRSDGQEIPFPLDGVAR